LSGVAQKHALLLLMVMPFSKNYIFSGVIDTAEIMVMAK
jgi:hypothetical protein